MTRKLQIAENFALPLELVTMTQAILARKRSGKSYTASVQAEEMLAAGQQIGVFDPTGAWWGLRASADGTEAGYAIVVFGGDHADAPLDYRAGKAMAAAFVEHGFSAIFDIGNLATDEQIQFVMDFCAELLRINRQAVHIFMDEADTFAPQRTTGVLQNKCLGTVSRLVKQGGIRGVGFTMITQRSASINWDILSQVDLLTILRMSAPHDVNPVVNWLQSETTKDFAAEVKAALPALPVGTAFFASAPLKIAERVQIRSRRTFNSGATPKPGERKEEPKVLAQIDIEKLGQRIADSVKRAQEASPEALQQRVVQLERELVVATNARPFENPQLGMTHEELGEVAMLKEKLDALGAEINAIELREQSLQDRLAAAAALSQQLTALLNEEDPVAATSESLRPMQQEAELLLSRVTQRSKPSSRIVASTCPEKETESGKLNGVTERILGAIAQFRAIGVNQPQKMHVCLFSGYGNMASKGFANAVSSLRTAGLIDYPTSGTVTLTGAGVAAAPKLESIRGDSDLQRRIEAMLSGPETNIFRIAVKSYPKPVAKEAVMAGAGYGNAASKGFANSVSRLRTLGFIDYPSRGEIVATPQCFLPTK